MGLVVLVKKMSVLINFLLQNANLMSVLSNIYLPKFCWSCLTGLRNFVNSGICPSFYSILCISVLKGGIVIFCIDDV